MIKQILDSFKRFDRDIDALSWILSAFMIALFLRSLVLIYEEKYELIWPIMTSLVPIVAALLVVRVANRQITHTNLTREDDRRQELVRVTHRLIAIARDMRQRVGYLHLLLETGQVTPLVLEQLADGIEQRYEALLEPEGYRYLSGTCVDLIVAMSGTIFGLATTAKAASLLSSNNPTSSSTHPLPAASAPVLQQLADLKGDLTKIIDSVYALRISLDEPHEKSVGA